VSTNIAHGYNLCCANGSQKYVKRMSINIIDAEC